MKPYVSFSLLLVLLCSNFVSAQKRLFYLEFTVENNKGELITGLKVEHIKLFDKDKSKEVKFFQNANKPMSVGFLVDVSPSMKNDRNSKISRIDWGRNAILDFIEKSHKDNEYFVISFSDRAVLLADFASNIEVKKIVQQPTKFESRKGGLTSLFDALTLSVEKAAKAKNDKRVLFVITDGQDNQSSYKFSEIEQLVKESNIGVNFMALRDTDDPLISFHAQAEEKMKRLTKISGGWAFASTKLEDCLSISSWLALVLQRQYRIGFEADTSNQAGEWRNLRIDLHLSKDERKLFGRTVITHRQGYYPYSVVLAEK